MFFNRRAKFSKFTYILIINFSEHLIGGVNDLGRGIYEKGVQRNFIEILIPINEIFFKVTKFKL